MNKKYKLLKDLPDANGLGFAFVWEFEKLMFTI